VTIIFLPRRFIALNIPAGRGRYEAAHAHAAKVATAIAATVRPMTDREFSTFMWQIEQELLKHAWRRDEKRIQAKWDAIASARRERGGDLAPV
jgi:hypothetical protein